MNYWWVVKITKTQENIFAVLTDVVMTDGTMRGDSCMRLEGSQLRSHEERGTIRVGGFMRVNLGPKSLPLVMALKIGESIHVQ